MSPSRTARPREYLDRSRARGWALQVLYRWESGQDASLQAALDGTLQTRRVSPRRTEYLERIVDTYLEHSDPVNAAIREALSNWTLERLASIDRSILRIAVTEMLYFEEIPPKVSIREAMLLAERYGGPESPAFVNGVLDAIYKKGGA